MIDILDSPEHQAERCVEEARDLQQRDQADQALEPLRRAVLLYATADAARGGEIPPGEDILRRMRADTCRMYGDALTAAGHHAEAANIYQEATDLYGLIEGNWATGLARECARKLLGNVAALRARPQDRLQLLIAHYERVQQQLALEPGTEARQGDCCVHIARIFQRRDRPEQSVERYIEALGLYARAEPSADIEMACAEAHHRVATLLAVRLDDAAGAAHHYRMAIALLAEHEPAVSGTQQSLELCRAGLVRAEAALREQGARHHRRRSRE